MKKVERQSNLNDSFQLTLQPCPPTQFSEGGVYPLKSRESINIYQNTQITVNGVENQILEKTKNGPTDCQQQSQCYINTTRGKFSPQDVQT